MPAQRDLGGRGLKARLAVFVFVRLPAGPGARQVPRTAMVASFGEARWQWDQSDASA
jgi:hypothetical protein